MKKRRAVNAIARLFFIRIRGLAREAVGSGRGLSREGHCLIDQQADGSITELNFLIPLQVRVLCLTNHPHRKWKTVAVCERRAQ